jgi:hypothetical protein
MDEERLPQQILNWIPTGRRKRERPKNDGNKAYSELWKDVVYEMETGMTDFIGDWELNDVVICHRTIACIHTYIHTHTIKYL